MLEGGLEAMKNNRYRVSSDVLLVCPPWIGFSAPVHKTKDPLERGQQRKGVKEPEAGQEKTRTWLHYC